MRSEVTRLRIERNGRPVARHAHMRAQLPPLTRLTHRSGLPWRSHLVLAYVAPAMAASSLLRSLSRLSRRGAGYAPATPFYHRSPCSPFSAAAADAVGKGLGGLGPTAKGEKARVVVLGTGWAGSRLMKDLDTSRYDVVCVSPRNHMVFTPLLASTCVGTLEFRSVAEPLARIQPAVSNSPGSYFLLARCTGVDPDAHTVRSHISGGGLVVCCVRVC